MSAPETSISGSGWAPLDADRARALAERLHRGQRDASGALLIDHVRRVAAAAPHHARVVAWLHEVLEHTATSEEALLEEGLSSDELRAIRLLSRNVFARSHASYLAHVERIASAEGPGAAMARTVKRADLADRMAHPSTRDDGWAPAYGLALEILRGGPRPGMPRSAKPSAVDEHFMPSV